ncbi:hypothetical protein M3J09_004647 [Ascochyta lentis]
MDSSPFAAIDSMHDMYPGVTYHENYCKSGNFELGITVDCLSVDCTGADWLQLDQSSLETINREANDRCIDVPTITFKPQIQLAPTIRMALIFFVSITSSTSSDKPFKQKLPMADSTVNKLFNSLHLDHAFL